MGRRWHAQIVVSAAVSVLLGLLAVPACVLAGGLRQTAFMLPVVINGQPYELETLEVAPDIRGRHPVALIAHGVPRAAEKRETLSPRSALVRAEVFARNGYAAFVVMRRGFGNSSGRYAESNGPCDDPDFVRSGRTTAADLTAALETIRQRPEVDPATIVVVGQSAGGFGSIALAADPPPGVRAVVNFAGGRGSAINRQCGESRIIGAFATFGRTARLPSIWIYAANDEFFPPPLATAFFTAYRDAGGTGEWAPMPAFGKDGHFLSSKRSGVPLWLPAVERFLAANRLPVKRGAGMEVVAALDAPPPLRLSDKGRDAWRQYLDATPYSAFAASPDGRHWGWAAGRGDDADAQATALGRCKGTCEIVATDGRPGR